MKSNDPLLQAKKRTTQYWYEDGLWEMGYGMTNLFLGIFFLLSARYNFIETLAGAWFFIQFVVIVAAILFVTVFVRFFKERITYPRTGYIAYPKAPTRKRLKRVLITALLSAGIAIAISLVGELRRAQNYQSLVTAAIFCGALVYLGYRLDVLRFYFLAALMAVYGFFLTLFTLDLNQSTSAVFIGFGALLFGSGAFTLLHYLRHTRSITELDRVMDEFAEDAVDPQSQDE